jgi:prepilin-type N-terminal cleavage/methylation domain-containing protein
MKIHAFGENKPSGRAFAPHRKNRGFTLIEVLVALSLLSIVSGMAYSFYLFAHKQVVIREKKASEFDNALLLLESAARNIRESKATLLLEASNWVFLTGNGDTASYRFADGTLKFNSVTLSIGGQAVPKFSFTGFGNDSLLDINEDGEVDFNELDTDGNDKLTGTELEKLAWIRCSLSIKPGDEETFATLESVKNNLASDEDGFQTYF